MMMKKLFGLSVMVLGATFGTMACSSTADDAANDEATGESQDELKKKDFFSCHQDSDCVAVEQAVCCRNGLKIAVNENKVAAYEKTKPAICNMMCPMFVILETRVPQCTFTTGPKGKCEMIEPEKIRCGGFTVPAMQHTCPTGYSCEFNHGVADIPGSCVKDPPPPPPRKGSCSSNSDCSSSQYCSSCWGKMQCIPKGALC